jgi:glycerol kinase
MKTRTAVVALDQGSSSSRALAFDAKGRVLARAQRPVRTRYPAAGRVEHDALDLARTLEGALDAVLDELPKGAEAVAGLSSQRSTVVVWDEDSGAPLAAVPSWQDSRAAKWLAPLAADRVLQAKVHEKTGLYLNPYYSAPKLRVLLEEVPAVRRAAEAGTLRAGPVSTWLAWRLSGGKVFRADPTTAQRMLLWNMTTGAWDEDLLSLFEVPRACLPELGPTAGPWCEFERRGRLVRLTAVVGDQQAAARGQGACEAGQAVLNYGTGAFFLLNTGRTPDRVPGLLASAAWETPAGGPRWFLEGTVHAAGTSLEWLKTNLGVLDDPRKADAACRRAKAPVLALPAIGGLGAPHWDYKTPAVFYGLGSKTTKDDLVRGVVEGLASLVADGVEAARAAGHDAADFMAGGGLARLDHLLAFQADVLQRPVARLKESEATALGAAALAAEAAGVPWTPPKRAVDRVFKPRLAESEAAKLRTRWRTFVSSQRELASKLA